MNQDQFTNVFKQNFSTIRLITCLVFLVLFLFGCGSGESGGSAGSPAVGGSTKIPPRIESVIPINPAESALPIKPMESGVPFAPIGKPNIKDYPKMKSLVLLTPTNQNKTLELISGYPQHVVVDAIESTGKYYFLSLSNNGASSINGLTLEVQDESVAKISKDGYLSNVATTGNTNLFIRFQSLTLTVPIKVVNQKLTGITIGVANRNAKTNDNIVLPKGYHVPLRAYGSFSGTTRDISYYKGLWKSSESSIASQSETVHGSELISSSTKVSNATITASLNNYNASVGVNTVTVQSSKNTITPGPGHIPLNAKVQLRGIKKFMLSDGSEFTLDISNNIIWSVYTKTADKARINLSTGLLTTLESGAVTVVAQSAIDGSKFYQTYDIANSWLTSITKSVPSITLPQGFSSSPISISANYSDYNGSSQVNITNDPDLQLNYDNSIVGVIKNGDTDTIVAKKVGSTSINFSYKGYNVSIPVTVGQPDVARIDVKTTINNIPAGTTTKLKAVAYLTNGESQVITASPDIKWISDNPSALKVSESGLATALQTSASPINVSATYHKQVSNKVAISVGNAVVSSVFIATNNNDKAPIAVDSLNLAKGSSIKVYPYARYTDGHYSVIPQNLVSWSISDTSKITMGGLNVLTSHAEGNASLTVTYNGVQAGNPIPVTVTPKALTKLEFSPQDNPLNMPLGTQKKFMMIADFSDGSQQYVTSGVTYSNSNSSIVSININTLGNTLTAKNIGNTTITGVYSNNGITQSATKVVNVAKAQLLSIELNMFGSEYISNGESREIVAIGHYSDNSQRVLTDNLQYDNNPRTTEIVRNGNKTYLVATDAPIENCGGNTMTATLNANGKNVRSNAISFFATPNPIVKNLEMLGVSVNQPQDNFNVFVSFRAYFYNGTTMDGYTDNGIQAFLGAISNTLPTPIQNSVRIDKNYSLVFSVPGDTKTVNFAFDYQQYGACFPAIHLKKQIPIIK